MNTSSKSTKKLLFKSTTLLNKLKKDYEDKQAKIDSLTTIVKKLSWNRTDRYKGILGTNVVIGPDPKTK